MQGKMFKCSTAHVRQLDVEQSLTGVGGPGGSSGVIVDPWEDLESPWGGPGGSMGGPGGSLGGPAGPWGGFLEVRGASW